MRAFRPDEPSIRDQIDLYIGTTDPEDGPGRLMFKSPDQLAYRHPDWADRNVQLKWLGDTWFIPETDSSGFAASVPLENKNVIAVLLPDGHFAKFQVTDSLKTAYPYRQIQYRWAYQTIPGYPRF
jgi:hypothetical protein